MSTLRESIRGTRILDLGPLPAPDLPPKATVQQALQQLVRSRRGAIVISENGKPRGVLTERDVLYGQSDARLRNSSGRQRVLVEEVMSQPAVTVRRQATLDVAIDVMARRKHRHVVVVDRHGDLVGLLSANDLMQFVADQVPEETLNLPPRLHQVFKQAEGG